MEAFFGPGISYPGLVSVRLASLASGLTSLASGLALLASGLTSLDPETADATDDNPSVKTFTRTPTQTLMTLIQTVMTLIQTMMTLTVEKNKSERPKQASIKLHRTGP